MKKVAIFIIILFIAIISISVIYQLCMIEEHTFEIQRIENDMIYTEKSIETFELVENNIVPQKVTYHYRFSAKNVWIRGENGKKITISDLKPGDTIHILRTKEGKHTDLAYSVEPLTNVKLIEVVKTK